MQISDNGIAFIESFEGFRDTPYNDVAGWQTVGYGHKILSGDVLIYPLSRSDGDVLMRKDCQVAENCINKNVTVSLTQNQFDALCSFVYNLGIGNFLTSTLHRLLCEGNYSGAAYEFPKWDRAGGVVVEGITRRRLAEQALFNTP